MSLNLEVDETRTFICVVATYVLGNKEIRHKRYVRYIYTVVSVAYQ